MVKAFHAAGIEVWLDVVYNHTSEAGADGRCGFQAGRLRQPHGQQYQGVRRSFKPLYGLGAAGNAVGPAAQLAQYAQRHFPAGRIFLHHQHPELARRGRQGIKIYAHGFNFIFPPLFLY